MLKGLAQIYRGLMLVSEPNIAILQYNFNEVNNKVSNKEGAVFVRPGYETALGRGKSTHLSHDVTALINESLILERLDANLRFDDVSHAFSRCDNESIAKALNDYADPIIKNQSHWMGVEIYKNASLRDKNKLEIDWFYDGSDWYGRKFTKNGIEDQKSNGQFKLNDLRGLFTLGLSDLIELAEKISLNTKDALCVSAQESRESNGKQDLIYYIFTHFGLEKIT